VSQQTTATRPPEPTVENDTRDDHPDIDVHLRDLVGDTTSAVGDDGRPFEDARAVREQLVAALSTSHFRFDDSLVKHDLDELLLALLAHEPQSHGQDLAKGLATVFGGRFSPGTVYPALHGLLDEGLVEDHEDVRSRRYEVADRSTARRRLRTTAHQHLVFAGIFLDAADEI
jgi:hypothetical protein